MTEMTKSTPAIFIYHVFADENGLIKNYGTPFEGTSCHGWDPKILGEDDIPHGYSIGIRFKPGMNAIEKPARFQLYHLSCVPFIEDEWINCAIMKLSVPAEVSLEFPLGFLACQKNPFDLPKGISVRKWFDLFLGFGNGLPPGCHIYISASGVFFQ